MDKWKKMLAALVALGYSGDANDVAALTEFVKVQNIDLRDADDATKSVDIAKMFEESKAAKPPKRVVFSAASEENADENADTVTITKSEAKELRSMIQAARDTARGSRQDVANGALGSGDVKVGNSRRHATDAERKSYNAKDRKHRSFNDADEAVHFGLWVKSVLAKDLFTAEDKMVLQKANITTTNTLGGALIPEDFVPQLIDLKEERGVARQAVPVTPMGRERVTYPRRTGGLTVYYPGEATAITESNPTVNNVTLTATKMACLTQVSSELLNDSAISFGDFVAREIAYAFADKEDEDLFNGDGTSTYGGRLGLRSALSTLSGTIANIAGLVVGSGNAYSELTIPDFNSVAGRLPAYVKNPKWYMHKRFFETVCGGLAVRPGASGGAGGATMSEVANYRMSGNPTWLGYPVVFSQVLPRTEGNSQVCCLFGEPGMGAMQGMVNGSMEIAASEHYGFNTDVLTIRGTQRHAITVHDPGNASATEALRIPGPYVGLITASS